MQSKSATQSKTIIFNVLAVLVVVAGYFGFQNHALDADTTDLVAKIMAAAIPVINIVLRFQTKQPVSL